MTVVAGKCLDLWCQDGLGQDSIEQDCLHRLAVEVAICWFVLDWLCGLGRLHNEGSEGPQLVPVRPCAVLSGAIVAQENEALKLF